MNAALPSGEMIRPKNDDEDCIAKLLIFCQASRAGCVQQPPQNNGAIMQNTKHRVKHDFLRSAFSAQCPASQRQNSSRGTTQKANFRLPHASIFTIFTVESGFDCWLSEHFKKICGIFESVYYFEISSIF